MIAGRDPARLEGSYEQISERLGVIESRVDRPESTMHEGFSKVRREMYAGFDKPCQEMRTQFYWLFGVIIIGVVVPIPWRAQVVLGLIF
jgi:hypothetical protein